MELNQHTTSSNSPSPQNERVFPNSFYEARISLITKLEKDITMKPETDILEEYWYKMLNKILTNRKHSKSIIYSMTMWNLLLKCKWMT